MKRIFLIIGFKIKIFLIKFIAMFIPGREKRRRFRSKWKLKIQNKNILQNYSNVFNRLQQDIKRRKLKVAFIVSEHQKWAYTFLYKEFEKSPYFEPMIFLCPRTDISENKVKFLASYRELVDFFLDTKMKVISCYNESNKTYLNLADFHLDIVFYQQPWGIAEEQDFLHLSGSSLICYVPYCVYSLKSFDNYLNFFHPLLWKYFVESQDYVDDYRRDFNATNCVAVGISKLDNWQHINNERGELIWEKTPKKRVIYAPHHSFFDRHSMATFHKNGKFILNLAQKHPEIYWLFKPHPQFPDMLLKNEIMTEEEIKNYYKSWDSIGKVYNTGNYYDLFATSDAIITDCISFLTEYLPSRKPVLYLRSQEQKCSFTSLTQRIVDNYYHIHNEEELEKSLKEVVLEENDTLKEGRLKTLTWIHQGQERSVVARIVHYLEDQFIAKEK